MNIVLTNPVFYNNGTSGASGVVGYESRHNRVVRYNLSSPDIGANKIDLSFTGNWEGAGTLPNTLYFFVGTDPNDHENAGSTSAKTGELTRKSGTYEYYGSVGILLMPNTTYYVWVFPSSTTFGWLYWGKNTGDALVETYGGAISTVATGSATLGQTVSLSVIKYVSDYTHTIKYTIGSQSGTICTKSSATSVQWTPSVDLAWQIKNSEQAAADLTVETYKGGTLIGTMQGVKFNLIVPQNVVPSVSATFEDPSNGHSVFGVHVQNVSYFIVSPMASGTYGSTIQKTEVLLNGESYSGGVVLTSGSLELRVVTTDSRGRTAAWATHVDVVEYNYPTASISASRCDEDGTPNETGEYANVTISAKTFNVNGRNEANATLNYGQQTQNVQVPIGTRDVVVIVPAPSVSAMQISVSVTDLLGSSALAIMTLSVGYATLDFLAGGKGIAFGTTAKKLGFTCAMDAEFTGNVSGVLPCGESTEYPGCFYRVVGGETEWYNPPCVVGTEYRTTQRWKGKPVYAKLLQFTGLFPNGAQTHYFANQFPGVTEVISVKANGTNGSIVVSLPFVDQANNFSCWAYNNSGGQIAIASNYKTAYTTVYALVQYIK